MPFPPPYLHSATIAELSDFCSALDEHLRARFGYRRVMVTFNQNANIRVGRVKVKLYLRLLLRGQPTEGGRWPNATLVIAFIEFERMRRGHGHALLAHFVNQAVRFGYHHIGIESNLGSDSMAGFLHRFSFNLTYPQFSGCRDWITSVEALAPMLREPH